VWLRIAAAVDGQLAALVTDGRLLWMPAHKSLAAALRAVKSDGSAVTPTDWRANRLCDVVARATAARAAPSSQAVACVSAAAEALRVEAATLGAVTRAANDHRTEVLTAAGETVVVTRRDSVNPLGYDKLVKTQRAQQLPPPPPPSEPAPVRMPPAGPSRAARWPRGASSAACDGAAARAAATSARRKRQRSADARSAARDDYVARGIIAEAASAATPSDDAAADERFAALRRRIALRQAAAIAPAVPSLFLSAAA
jgi:hypothetical protein